MGRSPIMLCGTMGTLVGGFVPELWGSSAFSLASLVFSAAGGFAGVWLGHRIIED